MKMYPPCMMQQQPTMKARKEPNAVKELIALYKFMEEMKNGKPGDKKPDEIKTRKGSWAWVEDPPDVKKYTFVEVFGISCLLALPFAAVQLGLGLYLLHAFGIK